MNKNKKTIVKNIDDGLAFSEQPVALQATY
jgi:hypothetical protein